MCVTICMDNSDLRSVGVISLTYTADADLLAIHAAGFYFSHCFWSLCCKSLTCEHKIEFLRLTVEELQALLAKGLIFLIIFGFFVENHLLANTKSSFFNLQFESYNLCR